MVCVASTDLGTGQAVGQFDPACRYRLHPQVALRPEPFGALAYHYGNRRLTFVRSHEMVALLHSLDAFPNVEAAIDNAAIDPARRPAMVAALCRLHDSEVISAC